jgi:hypothetical protein
MTKNTTAPAPEGAPPPTPSKLQVLVELLNREEGATLDAMVGATGWQAHSVRGAISGSLKKGRGLTIASEKAGAVRTYRIISGDGA